MEVNYLKTISVFLLSLPAMLVAFYNPIGATLLAVALAFFFDLIIGVLKGKVVGRKDVDSTKGKRALILFCIYIFLIMFLFTIGKLMKDTYFTQHIVIIVSVVTIWFYITNGFKNLKVIFPSSKVLGFFYWILNVEFVNNLPALKRFLEVRKDKEEEGNKKKE